MRIINIDNYNLNILRQAKNDLKNEEILIGAPIESYIATIDTSKIDNSFYVDFSNEIQQGFFRDCYLEHENTITFVMKLSKSIMLPTAELTHLVNSFWYIILSDYLPLETFNSKIRTIDGKCIADFCTSENDDNFCTIGYINLGDTFNQPQQDDLIINRDVKGKCGIDKKFFSIIYNKVTQYLENFLGGENEIF